MIRILSAIDDVERLRPLAESWQSECRANAFGMDADVEVFLDNVKQLTSVVHGDAIILEVDRSIVGIMGMVMFSSNFGHDVIANEHFWYVVPEHRGIGGKLVLKAMQWAKDKGATHLMLNASMLASDLHDEVCRMYEKLGLKKFETVYLMKIGG